MNNLIVKHCMKKTITVILAAAGLLAAPCIAHASETACKTASTTVSQTDSAAEISRKPKKEYKTVVFEAHLHCKNCVTKVTENISFEKGVKDLKVDLEQKRITITYDDSKTSVEKLAAAIEKLGYETKVIK